MKSKVSSTPNCLIWGTRWMAGIIKQRSPPIYQASNNSYCCYHIFKAVKSRYKYSWRYTFANNPLRIDIWRWCANSLWHAMVLHWILPTERWCITLGSQDLSLLPTRHLGTYKHNAPCKPFSCCNRSVRLLQQKIWLSWIALYSAVIKLFCITSNLSWKKC